ncbi:MAG: alpha/beta hydrolase [Deltaproteobacteria bacterium]|jgi:pimeloyl-ACP methyl ester carboxylesterase|nr:alpha/beta hydrolase [Deltaproteobacteria bacterium]
MMKKKLPIFATSEGRAKYMAAYEAMFSLWKVPHDSMDVKTSYGSTHINVTGPADGNPLVVLHAAGLSSTVWFANIAELSAHHRVFAVDVIGDAGKSVANRLLDKRTDYAKWLKEVFDGLKIERCQLVGHSYGGWLTLNMALAYPERLHKIVLLAPAASFRSFGFITKLMFFLGEFKIHPPAKSVLKAAAAKGTVLEETFIHLMEEVTRYCRSAIMYPTVFTDQELKQIDLPTLLLIGAGEKIYNAQKSIQRAQQWMPGLTAEIIPDAGHLLIMDQPEIINARILRFLSSD